MSANPFAILSAGLVTSVGLTAERCCAAFRAKVANPRETRFVDSSGRWIMAHEVPLDQPWRGLTKLAKMAAMAIEEALHGIPRKEWNQLPVLLCVAESKRPGRLENLDEKLFELIQAELGAAFAAESAIVPHGRVGVAVALSQSRNLMAKKSALRVLVVAADSFLSWPTLSHYERHDRLLTETNSNGFMPGEGAGALLVGPPDHAPHQLLCTGIGFGREAAHVESGEPLRGEGLSLAIKAAMADGGCRMDDMDFRIADVAGEQYYFKESALAISRTLRTLKEEFDIWHPAECTGEVGATAGISMIALALSACHKRFGKGSGILAHMANDEGQRAALALRYRDAR